MSSSRIELFKQMLEGDPANTSVLFGLAKEYEKANLNAELLDTLNRYLDISDDEGNAYGMLANAYARAGEKEKARAALLRGVEIAQKHGHPGMAEEYKMLLASDYED
jgi:tetratricopeptide (TPR) repeat protein